MLKILIQWVPSIGKSRRRDVQMDWLLGFNFHATDNFRKACLANDPVGAMRDLVFWLDRIATDGPASLQQLVELDLPNARLRESLLDLRIF